MSFMHVLRVRGSIGYQAWSNSEKTQKNSLSYQASSSYNLEEFPGVLTRVLYKNPRKYSDNYAVIP